MVCMLYVILYLTSVLLHNEQIMVCGLFLNKEFKINVNSCESKLIFVFTRFAAKCLETSLQSFEQTNPME